MHDAKRKTLSLLSFAKERTFSSLFDAFGLPAENYAIKNGIHPHKSTHQNISTMKQQLTAIGALYNWDKEVITCDEEYYKWTQWLFLKLYNNNLAYQKEAPVNWCSNCATVLANEQVKQISSNTKDSDSFYNGCDRCKTEVVLKNLKQWFFKITNYADDLLDYTDLKWPNKTIAMQKNWIGKSRGATIDFSIEDSNYKLNVFTTRPDTLFGVTYMVIAPEHEVIKKFKLINNKEITSYCQKASNKSELQRSDLDKGKTGVFSGLYAIHPISQKKIPIWIADYVMMGYGTGAIMAVPAHDQRDFDFAKKYDIEIAKVVDDGNNISITDEVFSEYGVSVNSDYINGLKSKDAIKEKLA